MKYLLFTILSFILSVNSLTLPYLYTVQSYSPLQISVIDINAGKVIQTTNVPNFGTFLGIVETSNYGFDLLLHSNSIVNTYNYSVSTNKVGIQIKNYPVSGINLAYQQFGVDSLSTDYLFFVGGSDNNYITIFTLDFTAGGKFSRDVIKVQFDNYLNVTQPTGCYDADGQYYYIFYLESGSGQPTLMRYDTAISNIDITQPTNAFTADVAVNLFFANHVPYAVQYVEADNMYYLYSINTQNLNVKQVFSISTQFFRASQNQIYFASNNEYVVFMVGTSQNTVQFVTVSLTNYKVVATSPAMPNNELYLYYASMGELY